MDPDEVRRIFDRSLETPAPPPSTSVATAIALGRRRVRRRRLAASTLSGVAALLVVAGGTAIAGVRARSSAGLAPQPAATPATPTPASATPRPARFDPRFVQARIGWLPPGLQVDAVSSSELTYATSYQYKPPPGGHTEGSVVRLELQQPASTGSSSRADESTTTPAPPVNGHPAVWVHGPGEDAATARLRWSFGPGAWAILTVAELRGGLDTRQSARRIADSVRIGTFAPITTPFRLARVPAGLSLASVWISLQDDVSRAWEAGLILAGGGAGVQVHVFPKPDCVCANKFDTKQNTTINGTPAWVTDRGVTLYFGRVIAEIDMVSGHHPSRVVGNDSSGQGAAAPPKPADIAAGLTVYPDRADWRAPVGP